MAVAMQHDVWHYQARHARPELETTGHDPRGSHHLAVAEIYIKLVVGFPRDPKVRALARFGPVDAVLARDLYVQMILHCKEYLTDGFVPATEVGLLVYPLDAEHGNQLAKQLASVGLTKEVTKDGAPGWDVCAFLRRNMSRAQVETLSAVRAVSGAAGGRKSRRPRKPAGQRSTAGRDPGGKQVANQSADTLPGTLPPIDRDRDRDIPTTTSSGTAAAAPGVRDIVGAFIEGATASGQERPAASIVARVGKQARQLLAEGKDAGRLITAARNMGAGEWNDLAVQLRKDDAAANGAQPRPGKKTNYTDEEYASGWG